MQSHFKKRQKSLYFCRKVINEMKQWLIFSGILLFILTAGRAEEEGSENPKAQWQASVSLQSQHYWRGLSIGKGPSLEADYSLTLDDSFSMGLWSGLALNSSYKEVDLYIAYTHNAFKVSLINYYCPQTIFSDEFINFCEQTTAHTLDIIVACNPRHIPISVQVSTMIWGDDQDDNHSNFYSTYVELGYHHQAEELLADFIIGYTPWESYYGPKDGVVNLQASGVYTVMQNNKHRMLCNAHILYSPMAGRLMFGTGITFSL